MNREQLIALVMQQASDTDLEIMLEQLRLEVTRRALETQLNTIIEENT